jgi:hypothetical protein
MIEKRAPIRRLREWQRCRFARTAVVVSALVLAGATAHAQTRLLPAVTGLQNPVDITHSRDGTLRLFIVEQPDGSESPRTASWSRRRSWI